MKKWVIILLLICSINLYGDEKQFASRGVNTIFTDVSLGLYHTSMLANLRAGYDFFITEHISLRGFGRINVRDNILQYPYYEDHEGYGGYGGVAIHYYFSEEGGFMVAMNGGVNWIVSDKNPYHEDNHYAGLNMPESVTSRHFDFEVELKIYVWLMRTISLYLHTEFGFSKLIDSGVDTERSNGHQYFMIGAGIGF